MSHRTPSYRQHKPSGQAVVTLNGRDFYLGVDSPQSRAEYDRLVAEWLAGCRCLPQSKAAPKSRTITEVILAFWDYAEKRYPPSGRELANFRYSLQPLRDLYGHTLAQEFGPRALKTVQLSMSELGWCRNVINRRITRIKTMFKWAESEELVPASTLHALQTVSGLRKGMPGVRETTRIAPLFGLRLLPSFPIVQRR